jgi:ferredoxin
MKPGMATNESLFKTCLDRHNDAAWAAALDRLMSAIHPVDQRAVRIWFSFFPLKLHRAVVGADNPARTEIDLALRGRYRLADQVDSSHRFLYGHRFWPGVKLEVNKYLRDTPPADRPLEDHLREAARRAAETLKTETELVTAITAVAFMTLQQVGAEIFSRPAEARDYTAQWRKSPSQIIAERARDDSQGLFGFLRSVDQVYTVTFREYEPDASFRVVNAQDLCTAAAKDKRDYRSQDERCIEGPIPVECRTSACGTCWVGILSETSKLDPPTAREVRKMKEFGYAGFTGTPDSPIRLACQTSAHGNASIVIPPWNGRIGRLDE